MLGRVEEVEGGGGVRSKGMSRVVSLERLPRNGSFPEALNRAEAAQPRASLNRPEGSLPPASLAALRKKERSADAAAEQGRTSVGFVVASMLLVVALVPLAITVLLSTGEPTITARPERYTGSHAQHPPVINRCQVGDADCILGTELFDRLLTLGDMSEVGGQLDRPYLSRSDLRVARLLKAWMEDAGMESHIDTAGNVVGSYRAEGSVPRPKVLLLGSHYDTVSDAGRFDGVYGVLAAVSAVKVLHETARRLPFTVQVVAFSDEEGNNAFGTTNTGAKAFMGEYLDPASAERLLERHAGIGDALASQLRSLRQPASRSDVIRGLGRSTGALDDIVGFVELHIEQGPVLEAENRPIAVVEAINGQTRMQVQYFGESGHAGTVPMRLRKDALSAAAEAVTTIESIGSKISGVVTTVGTLHVARGSTNVVPGEVQFSVDIRAPNDGVRQEVVNRVIGELEAVGTRRGLSMQVEKLHEAQAVQMSSMLQDQLVGAIVAENVEREASSVLRLSSGAGHDAMIVGTRIPSAMLFLRCKGGISHNPAEWLEPADATAGARVLLHFIASFHGGME